MSTFKSTSRHEPTAAVAGQGNDQTTSANTPGAPPVSGKPALSRLSLLTSESALNGPASAGVGLRSPSLATSLASPCFVHSHLDNSLTSYLARKEALAEKKRKQALKKAGLATGGGEDGEDSDTASDGETTDTIPEGDEEGLEEDEELGDEGQSLTKQLAETAVSVRAMSKQLGRARVISHIQSIMIITKARDNNLITLTRQIALWLMQTPRNGGDRGLVVYVDNQLRKSKRFDAAGIERDHPELLRPLPRRYSRSSTASTTNVPSHSSSGGGGGGNVLNASRQTMAPLSSMSEPSLKRADAQEFCKEEGQLRYWTNEMCAKSPHLFDFVITLGGDGTVLYASWLFQQIVPPIIPFALGSLGFLTCFDFEKYSQTLNNAINNGIRVNLRMRFTCTVFRAMEGEENKRRRAVRSGKTGGIFMKSLSKAGWEAIESGGGDTTTVKGGAGGKKDKEIKCFSTRPVESFEVLNDLVVDRGPSPYVSLLELFGDEHHLTTVQADGLTVSTPTGSTAYSLAAGGSLTHPEIPALLITPICPHTLSFRPMLLPDSMELRICVPYNSRSTAWASFDGRGRVELRQGDHIKITASPYPFPTVCANNQSKDWFNSISRTLKWNERERQKSFVIVEEGKKKKAGAAANDPAGASSAETAARKSTNDDEDDEDEDEDDDSDEEDNDEEDEAFEIDDLSSAPTTTASSPVLQATSPSNSVPALPTASQPSDSAGQRQGRGRQASSSSSSSSLQEDDRFGAPRPHPPRVSARHSFSEHTHNLNEALSQIPAPRNKSRSRSRDRNPILTQGPNKPWRNTAAVLEGDESSEPGSVLAVVGASSDSSASGGQD